ncbi:MAG: sugar transferase [Ignavibacteriaceae bacterium]
MIKNIVDFSLGIIIFLIALPLYLIIFLILAIIFKSSPFIIQKRGITKGNKVFRIYKFKTIKPVTINVKDEELILYKKQLAEYVPSFCRWLRKSGLDELPQIINVLKNEMSIIGPRPLMISDLEILKHMFPEYYLMRDNIKVKPGITGLWQVYGKREEGIGNLLHLDLDYDKSVSAGLDLKILLSTIPLVFRGKHSDSIISGMNEDRTINKLKVIIDIS